MAGAPTDLLAQVPLFSGLKKKELQRIARTMRDRTVETNEALAVEGKEGVGFFLIESGSALVTVGGEDRRTLGPGDYFGEIALIAGTPRTATVVAQEPLRCWGLTHWDFRPLVQGNASIAWELLEALAKMFDTRNARY
jgi:CRP-like cAMP-binding protein